MTDAEPDRPEPQTEPGPGSEGASEAETGGDPATASPTGESTPDRGAPSLVVEGLVKRFGGLTAVDGVSFEVERGSMTGLIGPNGAGKSTTFNCITGVHTADEGSVTFEDQDITGLAPHQVANRGLVRTFQVARELEEMTVLENLMLAPRGQVGEGLAHAVVPGLRGRVKRAERELREEVWDTLEFFEIDHLAREDAGNLSGGQRKLLELARALMLDPDMMLLDEPFAGVNPTLERKLLDRIHTLREDGLTFLIVEHDVDLIMENCEHVVVMHQGQKLAEGPPETVRNDDRVIDAYLGGDV